MRLDEANLTRLILDLTDQYGVANPRPRGGLLTFHLVANQKRYETAQQELLALLNLHGVAPINLSIAPGPEIRARQNRDIRFGVPIRDVYPVSEGAEDLDALDDPKTFIQNYQKLYYKLFYGSKFGEGSFVGVYRTLADAVAAAKERELLRRARCVWATEETDEAPSNAPDNVIAGSRPTGLIYDIVQGYKVAKPRRVVIEGIQTLTASLFPVQLVQEVENLELCTRCGGKCCKSYPGITSPEDWGAPNKKAMQVRIAQAVRSGEYEFDDWYGDPSDPKGGGQFDVRMIRPTGRRGVSIRPGEFERCQMLGDQGCKLPHDARPKQCRDLVPGDPHCTEGFSKRQAAIAWMPYQDVLAAVEDQAW